MASTKQKIDGLVESIFNYAFNDYPQPEALIDIDMGHRGGGMKVNAEDIFKFKNQEAEKECGTYQNYLGGGMLGKICFGSNFNEADLFARDEKNFNYLKAELTKLHHKITNHDDILLHQSYSYEENQSMPVSAY